MAEQFSGLGPIMKPPERRNMIYTSMQLNLPLFPHRKICDLRRKIFLKRLSLRKKKCKPLADSEPFVHFDFQHLSCNYSLKKY